MRGPTFLSNSIILLLATCFVTAAPPNPKAIDANRPVLKDVYILQRDDGTFAKRQLGGDNLVSFILGSLDSILRSKERL